LAQESALPARSSMTNERPITERLPLSGKSTSVYSKFTELSAESS
jgi:hypothetical protein